MPTIGIGKYKSKEDRPIYMEIPNHKNPGARISIIIHLEITIYTL